MDDPKKFLQPVIGTMIITALVGCTVLVTPFASPTPTEPRATKINATPTQAISSFEECIEAGNLAENTYPRQCTSERGKVFKEAFDAGILFSQTYGAQGDETAYFITSTKDDGYLITGTVNYEQCLILKLDASRETEWESAFGEELREEFQLRNAWFRCWSARQTSDGGYTIMGTARSDVIEKPFMLKLDRDGNRLSAEVIPERKEKFAYLGPGGKIIWLNSFNIASTVVETSEGGYALVGIFPKGSPDSYTHIIKTDARGAYLWEKNLCLDKKLQRHWQKAMVCSNVYFWEAIQSQDGGYVLTGGIGNGIWLLKTDANGNIEWMQSYSGNAGHAILQTSDGGFLIAGQRRSNGILIKTDEDGVLQWSRYFGGDQHDTFTALEQRSDGEILVLGGTKSFGEGREDIWLLGIDITVLQ